MKNSQWENLNHLFCFKGLFLTKNLRGVGQGLEQTYLYLWYSLFQWDKYNVRAVTIYDYLQYTISDNIRLSTIYNQWQYKIIYNIQSVAI